MQADEQFSTNAALVLDLLRERGWTLVTAESCTGGQLGHALTNVTGASDVYLGGIIAYSNQIKEQLLNVPAATLAEHGAVSAATAEAMAQGARERLGASAALATTGIAGPGGGSAEKPVGLVYIGLATPQGVWSERHVWDGTRQENKYYSVRRGLQWLAEWLKEHDHESGA